MHLPLFLLVDLIVVEKSSREDHPRDELADAPYLRRTPADMPIPFRHLIYPHSYPTDRLLRRPIYLYPWNADTP